MYPDGMWQSPNLSSQYISARPIAFAETTETIRLQLLGYNVYAGKVNINTAQGDEYGERDDYR